MGRDKALMSLAESEVAGSAVRTPLESGEATLITRVLCALRSVTREVLLATSRPEPYAALSLPSVPDAFEEIGPLGGLIAGLEALSHVETVLVVACDLPFVEGSALRALAELAHSNPTADVVVPSTSGGDEPLLAAYRPRVARILRKAVEERRLRLLAPVGSLEPAALDGACVLRVPAASITENAELFLNVNTPSDLDQARGCERARGLRAQP